ncbi:GNAT family N-acetyltransferase [Acetanaerobacterium elongatum]|uniref:Protein N-acetyltransferase, RimJ/RimL family n=1 Tax=Acetanaerobacterium elongatum TaxID=258515 RepID=A0A1G9W7K0_9FIRM|nr:GNAT family N-acetyltransferase [Acetanaerobacterium elongatum]SDM80283.1 Protein N-acetyltransferase, RimJ/RimL family [Acetanaerobacterium elongatum]
MNSLLLRPLEDKDIPLLREWLYKEYIAKWYKEPAEWLNEVNGRFTDYHFVTHLIAECNGIPIGFCQYYACINAKEDWYGDIPLKGTYSIDYLIGEETYLHKGLGKEIILLLTKKIFGLNDAKRIIVQPEEDNANSCKTLLAGGYHYDLKNKLYYMEKQA